VLIKYLVAWLPMVVIGVLNGVLRQATYAKAMSDLAAHQVSVVTAVIFLGIYMWGVARILPFASGGQALVVGVVWLALTVLFEFGFGHFVMGNPYSVLLADYNIFNGHFWPVVLLWIAIAPSIFYVLRRSSG